MLAAVAGCGRSVSSADAGPELDEGSPSGDQTVFSGIDVRLRVSGFDAVDWEAFDSPGAQFTEPPVGPRAGVIVEINGATFEGRVPGLRVFGDGIELTEVGSAGLPQRFSFHHSRDALAHGQPVDLGFRYEASEFALSVQPPVIEIMNPTADDTLAPDEPLTLEWTGTDAAPKVVTISPRGTTCAIGYAKAGETTFAPERRATGTEPPCRFELSADWELEMPEPESPFHSLVIEGSGRRIQRFNVE